MSQPEKHYESAECFYQSQEFKKFKARVSRKIAEVCKKFKLYRQPTTKDFRAGFYLDDKMYKIKKVSLKSVDIEKKVNAKVSENLYLGTPSCCDLHTVEGHENKNKIQLMHFPICWISHPYGGGINESSMFYMDFDTNGKLCELSMLYLPKEIIAAKKELKILSTQKHEKRTKKQTTQIDDYKSKINSFKLTCNSLLDNDNLLKKVKNKEQDNIK